MTDVVVAGGGIGGLAATIALRHTGVDAAVYEQADEHREIGAGLTLWTNASRALDALGIGSAIKRITRPLDVIETRNTGGRVLSVLRLDRLHEQLGATSVGIHRRELLGALADALPRERIHTGARLERVEQEAGRARAHFGDGREAEADVLVGADGIFSTVRSQVLSQPPPKYGGYVVWRGVVQADMPADWPPHSSVRTISRDQHFGVVELTRGRYFWFATRNQPKDEPERGGRRATLLRLFGKWHDPIPQLLERTPEQEMLRHALYRMRPLRRWSDRRVTLLGDAAHPMAPSLGQGACQALEDAVVLGHEFASAAPLAAIANYERKRKPRATSIVRWSRFFAAQEQLRNPMLAAGRDLGTWLTPDAIGARMFRRFLVFEPPS